MRYRRPLRESQIRRRRMIRESSVLSYSWGEDSLPGGKNYEFVEYDDDGNEYRGGDIVCIDINRIPINQLLQIGREIGLAVDSAEINGRTVTFLDEEGFEIGDLVLV